MNTPSEIFDGINQGDLVVKNQAAPDTMLLTKEISKPIESISHIIAEMSPFSQKFIANKGNILRYNLKNKQVCYFLYQGNVTLNRREDGKVVTSERAPFIFGLSNQLACDDNLYIKVTETSELSWISLERFNLIIESFKLWEDYCKILMYKTSVLFQTYTRLSHLSSYEQIRYLLIELMNEPDKVRLSTTAANYIKERTYLSRSGVMRILAELREQGFITLQRGVLLEMKELPLQWQSHPRMIV